MMMMIRWWRRYNEYDGNTMMATIWWIPQRDNDDDNTTVTGYMKYKNSWAALLLQRMYAKIDTKWLCLWMREQVYLCLWRQIYQVFIPMEARIRMLCLQRHRYWWAMSDSYKRCSQAGMKFWFRTVPRGVYMPMEAKERDAYGGESSNCLIQIYPTEASHPVIQQLAFKPMFCDWRISHCRPPKCNIMWALRYTIVPQG